MSLENESSVATENIIKVLKYNNEASVIAKNALELTSAKNDAGASYVKEQTVEPLGGLDDVCSRQKSNSSRTWSCEIA